MIPVGPMDVTAISGIPPLTVALQGTQAFNFLNSAGTSIGTVGTVDTTTTDGFGIYTEAVLVTNDGALTNIGTAAADVPAVGSIFNTINFDGIFNVYSDLCFGQAATNTRTRCTRLWGTSSSRSPLTRPSRGTQQFVDHPPERHDLDPITELGFTGINGLPPVDVGVQGWSGT